MEWHRLFGLVLTDYFTGSPFEVQIEPDLSLQQQFLDLVIVRRGKGAFKEKLPDGLDDLGRIRGGCSGRARHRRAWYGGSAGASPSQCSPASACPNPL